MDEWLNPHGRFTYFFEYWFSIYFLYLLYIEYIFLMCWYLVVKFFGGESFLYVKNVVCTEMYFGVCQSD